MLDLKTGDSPSYGLTAKKDGATFNVDSGATVRANLIDKNNNVLISAVTLSSASVGADWPNSLILASFTTAETSAVTYSGKGFIELEINDANVLTWTYSVDIQLGTIT